MKKFLCVMVLYLLAVSEACGTTYYYDEGNDGFTEATAYIIDSVEDYNMLARRINYGNEQAAGTIS